MNDAQGFSFPIYLDPEPLGLSWSNNAFENIRSEFLKQTGIIQPKTQTLTLYRQNNIQFNEHNTRDEKEDIKPSRIPALKLKIGSWEKKSTSDRETRLEAKFYHLKKQIVWEILDIALNKKRKIEIKFDDISEIKAFSKKGGTSTLIVQVKQAPLLWIEKEPEPMKHTIWMQEADDFTHGQAATNMIHELEFEEGQLEKHYEKLLKFDSRLRGISQNPTSNSLHSLRTQLAEIQEFLMNDQQGDNGDQDSTFSSFANGLPDLCMKYY